MPRDHTISRDGLREILELAFALGRPLVYDAYSEPGLPLRQYLSVAEMEARIDLHVQGAAPFPFFCFYYPEAKGFVSQRRISLNPPTREGHTFRYTHEGWGFVHIHCHHFSGGQLKCCISLNTKKRAEAWFPTSPQFKTPNLWNWKVLESIGRKLDRKLKQCEVSARLKMDTTR